MYEITHDLDYVLGLVYFYLIVVQNVISEWSTLTIVF